MNRHLLAAMAACTCTAVSHAQAPAADRSQAVGAFETVRQVLQHPRCQNCHIPGNAPLQYDQGLPHAMNVKRGADGHGFVAMKCASCHQTSNLPADYGLRAPPGAPNWHLPPENMKMVFISLPASELCRVLKDPKRNGGRRPRNSSLTSPRTASCCGAGSQAASARPCPCRMRSSWMHSNSGSRAACPAPLTRIERASGSSGETDRSSMLDAAGKIRVHSCQDRARRIEFHDQKHHEIGPHFRVIRNLVHRHVVGPARFRREHRMGVPFADVVEFGVLISGAGEKSSKPPKSIFYTPDKRGDGTSLVYCDVHNLESVRANVRRHQDTAYLTLSGVP